VVFVPLRGPTGKRGTPEACVARLKTAAKPAPETSWLLSPYSTVLLEKLPSSYLVKKFPAIYGTRRFITAFTSARHLSVFWASSIQSVPLNHTSRRSILILSSHLRRNKCVPVTTAWRVLTLRMEERPPIWRVAANILNKQWRTADKGWSCSSEFWRGDNNCSP